MSKDYKDSFQKNMENFNQDNWSNAMKGFGVLGKDASIYTNFQPTTILSDEELTDIYTGNGLGKKIVDTYANELVRQWFEIEGDTNGEILKYLSGLSAKKEYNKACKWAYLYGAGFIVMDIEDGTESDDDVEINLIEPVNINRIQTIKGLWTFDRIDLIEIVKYYTEGPNFGQPEIFKFRPFFTDSGKSEFIVHESRVVVINGEEIPNDVRRNLRQEFRGFGMPFLQFVYNELLTMGVSFDSVKRIMHEFIIGKINITGLQKLISGGKSNLITTRINLISLCKSIANTIILDEKESFERVSASVTGLDGILDRLMMWLSGATGIPVTKLFGRSAAGMNSTGEGDQDNFYDEIKSRQEYQLEPGLRKLVDYIVVAKDGPKGFKPNKYEIVFNPLKQMSEKEKAEIKKLTAETDKMYIESQVLSPDEVAQNRFGGDNYSTETVLLYERTVEEPDDEQIEE
jgi:phage-related protein (TIGR01555 family)